MALILETGVGITNSNSYASVAEANAYFTDRGNTVWTASVPIDSVKENALIIATDYIDAFFRDRWKGRKASKDQALTWPRYGAVIDGDGSGGFVQGFGPTTNGYLIEGNVIHPILKKGTIELALRTLSGGVASVNLAPDVKPGATAITRKKIGPIEIEYKAGYNDQTLFRFVSMILAPLTAGGSDMSIQMQRS